MSAGVSSGPTPAQGWGSEMAVVRKLKKSQSKRIFQSKLVFAVAADPLNASGAVVLTLWSGRHAVSRALSPEWAAVLAPLLIPGSQLSEGIKVDFVGPQDNAVGSIDPTVERVPVEAFSQDRILAGIEADLALIVGRGCVTVDRLKGVNVGAFSDLMQDVTLSFLNDLLHVSELRRRVAQFRFDGAKVL